MSIDGRIDCAMTSQLPGVDDYYATLDALETPTTVSGRVTAQLEMAEGIFEAKDKTPFGKESFSKKASSAGYEIVADTHGSLLTLSDVQKFGSGAVWLRYKTNS